MKVLQSSILRAICAIVVGALLVKYREQTVTWITILIGVIFFVSGVVSLIAYFATKSKSNGGDLDIYDAQGNLISQSRPTFPIVGLGSLIFGGVLALLPGTFVNGLGLVLAAILILGAINQFFNLAVATRFASIGLAWWILPAVVLLIGIIAIVKPSLITTAPLLVIGWSMMVYGVVDIINTIKIYRCKKRVKAAAAQAQSSDASAASSKAEVSEAPDVSENTETAQSSESSGQPED